MLDLLRNVARAEGRVFQEVLTLYGLERFLYRLSVSSYREQFVLKGALVMLTWPGAEPDHERHRPACAGALRARRTCGDHPRDLSSAG